MINIIAGDFNTNIYPECDRISESSLQYDPTRAQLKDLTKNFIDSSELATNKLFHTFFQKTRGNRMMATHLDYIFIDKNYAHFIHETNIKFDNYDHLLVECMLKFTSNTNKSP